MCNMHVHFTHPDFADTFFSRVAHARKLMESHPVLEEKHRILTNLSAHDITQLLEALTELRELLQKEQKLWSRISFAVTKSPYTFVENHPLHAYAKELHEDEVQFVKTHFSKVQSYFPGFFEKLYSAAISDAFEYEHHKRDYWYFQQAVDSIAQLESLHAHLSRQTYLTKVLENKCRHQAHTIHEELTELIESHDGQIAYIARMVPFTLSAA